MTPGPSVVTVRRAEATPEAVLGETITMTATLEFTVRMDGPFGAPGPDEGGSVTFEVFRLPVSGPPEEPSFNQEPVFTSEPHPVVVDPATMTAVVQCEPFEPTELGNYYWRMRYSGTQSGWPACIYQGHRSLVDTMAPSMETRATVASRVGQFIVGTVQVTGPPYHPPPAGSVTFQVSGPDGFAPTLMTDADVPLGTTDPPMARSKIFRPTKPGKYYWSAWYSGGEGYIGGQAPVGVSVVSEHVAEETMTVAEVGVPVRHEADATARGRVTYAEVVELLSLPGEVPDE